MVAQQIGHDDLFSAVHPTIEDTVTNSMNTTGFYEPIKSRLHRKKRKTTLGANYLDIKLRNKSH
jgi:hypothetical protein